MSLFLNDTEFFHTLAFWHIWFKNSLYSLTSITFQNYPLSVIPTTLILKFLMYLFIFVWVACLFSRLPQFHIFGIQDLLMLFLFVLSQSVIWIFCSEQLTLLPRSDTLHPASLGSHWKHLVWLSSGCGSNWLSWSLFKLFWLHLILLHHSWSSIS